MPTIKKYHPRHLIGFLCLVCLLSGISLIGQDQKNIRGKVLDIITKEPIEGVNILIRELQTGTTTDSSGRFSIRTVDNKTSLIFSHIAYQENEVLLDSPELIDPLIVYLTPTSFELSEAIITAGRQYIYSIIDFHFIDTNLLLLAHNHKKNTLRLFLMTESYDTLAVLDELPEKKNAGLYKDCLGNCHLLFKHEAYQVFYEEGQLKIVHPVAREHFIRTMENCLFETDEYLVFKRSSLNQFLHSYFAIAKKDSEVKEFISDLEHDKMYALNDEMKFIARNPDAFPSSAGKALAMAYATQIAFKPSGNFLDKIGDSIYYFNHGNSRLNVYSTKLDFSKSIEIGYHEKESWEQSVLTDKVQAKAFTYFDSKGRNELHEINLRNGTTTMKLIIPLAFPEKVKINNGYVYFLYKEIGNIWARKELYRLKL